MECPRKLRVVLWVWIVLLGVWVAVFGGIFLILVYRLVMGLQENPLGIDLALLVIVSALTWVGVYLIKKCLGLMKGERRSDLFLRIVAGLNLLQIPMGTALGIVTFVVLGDSEVKIFLNNGELPMTKERLIEEVERLKQQ